MRWSVEIVCYGINGGLIVACVSEFVNIDFIHRVLDLLDSLEFALVGVCVVISWYTVCSQIFDPIVMK